MRPRSILALVLVLGWGACSDDTGTKPRDKSVDKRRDLTVVQPDATPDLPPVQPDLPKQPDGVTPDQPKTPDGVTPDVKKPDSAKLDVGSKLNDRCVNAQQLTLAAGKASVSSTTAGLTDEFAALECGGYTTFDGPQAYYKIDLVQGKTYKVALTPAFSAYFYVFSATAACQEAAIETDCASAGATGNKAYVSSNGTGELYFKAPTSGSFTIGVDSSSSTSSGTFKLDIEEFTPPTNGTCSTATPITLTAGKATINGSTAGVADEFSTLKCGTSSTLVGPQVYYSLVIPSGKSYKITLTPTFSAYLYVSSSSGGCSAGAISGYCGSGGATGDYMSVSSSATKSLFFTPNVADTYIIAVDSSYATNAGSFVLQVEEFTPPTNGTCANAKLLTLASGKVTENGTTGGLKDEFATLKCGGSTSFAGPQAYYKLAMTQGKGYKLTITPTFSAYLYVFSSAAACGQATIETDCASKGATGDKFGSASSGSATSYYFIPSTTGTYTLGVDSSSTGTYGDFKLDVEEYAVQANSTCAGAATVTLASGKATVTGSTLGTKDELATLKCGGTTSFAGPQLYYKVTLTGNTNYRIKLKPTFSAYMYLFRDSAACALAAIEADCASAGTNGDRISVSANSTKALYFKPAATGDYIIGVDSSQGSYAGDFSLDIEEFTTATNGTCATAQSLTLTGGAVTVSGDTFGMTDEFTGAVSCGGSALDGPQVYYRMTTQAGKMYKITLTTGFTAVLYLFAGASACDPTKIDGDCDSSGVTGDRLSVYSTTETLLFNPTAAGTYYIVVDSTDVTASYYGAFDLKVEEFTPPSNASCSTPQVVSLATSPVTVSGDTTGAPNQFGTDIGCGTGYDYDGAQLYYQVTLLAGKTYTIVATPTGWDLALYAFTDKTCTAATIETQCSSNVSDDGYTDDPETLTISPTTTTDYIIAIDTYSSTETGPFTLKISW